MIYTFKDKVRNGKSCNGWILVEKDLLKDEDSQSSNPQNAHLVEVRSEKNHNGKFTYEVNKRNVTLCERSLNDVEGRRSVYTLESDDFHKETINDLRIFLAQEENNGHEICGNCVARLYADFANA